MFSLLVCTSLNSLNDNEQQISVATSFKLPFATAVKMSSFNWFQLMAYYGRVLNS